MNKKRFSDQIVIVTGGARGIGASICESFAQEGAHVICDYNPSERSRKAFPLLRDKIEAFGGRITGYECDVSDYESVKKMASDIAGQFGHIDVLVNNAVKAVIRKFNEITPDDYNSMFSVNVAGAFWCTQAVLNQMLTQGYGSVVFISSNASVNGGAGSCLYPACKGAVESLMHGLINEVASKNIRINVVRPGWVSTELNMNRYSKEQYANYLDNLPMKRAGDPAEVAQSVLFMADRNNNGYVNGAILDVDGARTYNLRPRY